MKLWSFAVKACRRGGVCLKSSGAREACCGLGDVEVFASRALEVRCRRVASRDLELGRHAVGLGTLPQKRCLPQELRSSGGALQALPQKRYGDLQFWRRAAGLGTWRRHRLLEMRRRRVDVEVFASRTLELWRRAARVGTCRSLPQELWSSGGALQACCLEEVWRSSALDACELLYQRSWNLYL